MATEHDLDNNAIFAKFASLKRLHMEVSKQQADDYQKRLEKLKEEESNYMAKFLSQTSSNRIQEESSANRTLTSARRDLFLTSNGPVASTKSTHRSTHENGDHDWNLDDDFQPLNITDNDLLDERRLMHGAGNGHDDDEEEEDQPYIAAFQQLLHAHQQQAHHHPSSDDQENMLSTILEASCEDATPMTSLVDVHHRASPTLIDIADDDEEDEEEEQDDGQHTERALALPSIDDIPVCTVFSKNENLKYTDYIVQKLQTEKDQAFANQQLNAKEKRPFLKRRQGLAHYQAPPKRRQSAPKTNDNKGETQKRPTTASNARSTNSNPVQQRSRSNSSSNRPTVNAPRATTKQKSSTNSSKSSAPSIAPSNLLGQVDLDDDEDHQILMKKCAVTSTRFDEPAKKILPNVSKLIESKWNQHYEEERDQHDFDEEPFSTGARGRQRTSSHHSDIQSKQVLSANHHQDLDEFEKLEQYAEEHPSMLSTASYVEQVVMKDHQLQDLVRQKLSQTSTQHLLNMDQNYNDEDDVFHTEEKQDFMPNSNRILQRKVKPLKSKIEVVAPISEDEDEDEDHRWDDVAVAKVIPIGTDEYNSDSGTSSMKTDLLKQYQQKKETARSSEFGDDQSWAERSSVPASHNSLMLKTFPGLRQTNPTPAPVVQPPPPVSTDPNQDLSRLMREKSKELEKQIEIFQKENSKLESLCNERNLAIKKLKQDRDEFEKTKQKDLEEFQQMKEEEWRKLKQEKRLFEQHRQQLRDHPDKREREEIETLKKQVLALQEDLKQRETRWSANINRLKERIETLEYENAELKQEKDIIERKRLELMHQLQTQSKAPSDEFSSTMAPRKSAPELQQNKRPKSTGPSSKTQSMPKTVVVRNAEVINKNKSTANGRKTPTNIVGVNGIKNNVDTSRKLSSVPSTTKRSISHSETVSIIPTERVDSGNGESDDESHLIQKQDHYVSPPITTLINTEYSRTVVDDDDLSLTQRSASLDYKSLMTMASRATSSATTLLKQHQENLAMTRRSPAATTPTIMNNFESIQSMPRASLPGTAKTITFKENLPISNQDLTSSGIVEEIRHQDGRIERIKSDASKTIVFPNGSRQEIHPDGQHIRVFFYNGDYKEKFADGRCIYKYASTNTTETEYPDGTRVCEFPNGQIEKHFPDGRQEHTLPDRTKNIYLTDGTVITLKTNGEKFIQHKNQTKEIHTDTYKRKVFPNGSILTVFNTGEQEIRYPNGKIKLKDANGNLIMEKKGSALQHQ